MTIQELQRLYANRGGLRYREGVTQLEHALQCAALAEADNQPPSFVIAALLHDVGHLFENEGDVVKFTSDDCHEAVGARILAPLFGEAVCRPIALHVDAKRYLCFEETHYFEALSTASKASLGLQGGPFNAVQAAAFETLSYWRDAVALRRIDDTGKSEEPSNRNFSEYIPMMRRLQID